MTVKSTIYPQVKSTPVNQNKYRILGLLGKIGINTIALILGLTFAVPFYWLVSSAVKTSDQIFQMPPVWFPNPVILSNFVRVFTETQFLLFLKNTLVIAVPVTVGTVISCSMVAYGFSRIEWKGRDLFFGLTLAMLMLPSMVTLIPVFIIFRKLEWVGTYKPLIVPAFFATPYYIFMFRQFFKSIPYELSDSARVDGASEPDIFARIYLPLIRPAMAVVALFTFISVWGDFLGPLVYINRQEDYTITLGVYQMLGNRVTDTDWGIIMAISTMTLLPIVIIFFLAQRTFIEGINLTGLKA
jgi:multiple sugar transport system permease protein